MGAYEITTAALRAPSIFVSLENSEITKIHFLLCTTAELHFQFLRKEFLYFQLGKHEISCHPKPFSEYDEIGRSITLLFLVDSKEREKKI